MTNKYIPKFWITGPGIATVNPKYLVTTKNFKVQIKALKRIKGWW